MLKLLTWEEFRENTYSFLNSAGMASNRLKDMEARDRRRWHLADANNDDNLDREEFSAFLHPETEERMGEIVVTELMEDMDSDRTHLEKAAFNIYALIALRIFNQSFQCVLSSSLHQKFWYFSFWG